MLDEKLLVVPWEERKVKYIYPDKPLVIEEVKTPWDLLVEARYTGSLLGSPIHQISVRNGLERIFSIRQNINRIPLAQILTRPVGARVLLPYWEHMRTLNTSNTFNIDKQDLMVIDVLQGIKRANEPILDLARQFFVGRGGVLGGEHPSGCVIENNKEFQKWKSVWSDQWGSDLLCGNWPQEPEAEPKVDRFRTTQALDTDEALALVRLKFFETVYLDVRESWITRILDHFDIYLTDRPKTIYLYSGDENERNSLLKRAQKIMDKK